MPQVLSRRGAGGAVVETGVYVGRGSPFGNPFKIGNDGTRAEVIEKYEAWLMARPELVERVKRDLAGRDLICWCAPLPCHGDVLLRVANPQNEQDSGK